MRILICTHHLHGWGGSELVCIELFEALCARGCDVQIFSPFVDPTFAQIAFSDWQVASNEPRDVNLAEFDLVFVLHQTISRLLHDPSERFLTGKKRPVFVYLHLSPYEPFEAPGPFCQEHFSDLIYANSEETRDALHSYGMSNISLFQNPAPAEYASKSEPAAQLSRILSVSNHLPKELGEAFEIISARGIKVNRIGQPDMFRRVTPRDIQSHDAVVTIGKTVQYAFRSRRPVFCYDRFQGPGWLNPWQMITEATNFSGRCNQTHLNPETLAQQIIDGYGMAREWTIKADPDQFRRFFLEDKLDEIFEKVRETPKNRKPSDVDLVGIARKIRIERTMFSLVDRHYSKQYALPRAADIGEVNRQPSLFPIKKKILRQPKPDESMVIAAFSYRHDAHLVPALLENIGPSIHGYVALDDRTADVPLSDEVSRQFALFEAARELGAKWLFAVDPDERFEDRLANNIKALTTEFGPIIWTFECRELFHATRYRNDGIWNRKPRSRLFPCIPGMEPDSQALHGSWTKNAWKLQKRATGLNFYHLRMITPERRSLRRDLYAAKDPNRNFQDIGYDYLNDERGMVLVEIPRDRGYSPAHADDGGLWTAPLSEPPPTVCTVDPLAHKLRRLIKNRATGGYENAMYLAQDIGQEFPDDQEIALFASDSAMRAKHWRTSLKIIQHVIKHNKEPLFAHLLAARAYVALRETSQAVKAMESAKMLLPDSHIPSHVRDALSPGNECFNSKNALWRRWIATDAKIYEGGSVATNDLAVIVIGLHAPEELRNAIASIRSQSVLPEIVVINSGGGDPKAVLSDHLDVIRLINVEQRLFVGAARNIGIDASRAPFVAFLASDCIAMPGWSENRVSLHKSGYRAVAADIIPKQCGSIKQMVASYIIYPGRHPRLVVPEKQKYSLSYDRTLFETHGYFPDGMRIGEDTFLNNKLLSDIEIFADPSIQLEHKYPDTNEELFEDINGRARRRVFNELFPNFETESDLEGILSDILSSRSKAALALLEKTSGISDAQRAELRSLIKKLLLMEREATRAAGLKVIKAKELRKEAEAIAKTDIVRACEIIEDAIRLWPQSSSLFLSAAQIYSADLDHDKSELAVRYAKKALSINPNAHEALVLAMELLLSNGQNVEACKLYIRAVLLAPQNFHIIHAVRLLPGPKYRPLRVMMWQKAFFLNPWNLGLSNALSAMHKAAGNDAANLARARFYKSIT
jgi:tetratricopeptide (TPR) repeat protein